jgi:chemotaxis response regulator CheB
VIAEDESTCIVWGMPQRGRSWRADWVVPIEEVAGMIERAVKRNCDGSRTVRLYQ